MGQNSLWLSVLKYKRKKKVSVGLCWGAWSGSTRVVMALGRRSGGFLVQGQAGQCGG